MFLQNTEDTSVHKHTHTHTHTHTATHTTHTHTHTHTPPPFVFPGRPTDVFSERQQRGLAPGPPCLQRRAPCQVSTEAPHSPPCASTSSILWTLWLQHL